jgi:hypothetical protein
MGAFFQSTTTYTEGVSAITFAADNDTWTINPSVVVSTNHGASNVPTVNGDGKANAVLINDGHVFNGSTGSFAAGPPYGIMMAGANSRVVNNAGGTIAANSYAIFIVGTVENAGLILSGAYGVEGTGVAVENSGQILGFGGVLGGGTASRIENSGLIRGDHQAINISKAGTGVTTIILNAKAGTIKGGTVEGVFAPGAAIFSSDNNAIALDNKGLIDGKVLFTQAGNDSVANKGVITGETHLGPGDDRFTFAGGAQGSVFGEDGADRFDFSGRLAKKKNAAVIVDFTPGEDVIGLSKKLFKGIGKEGTLKDKYFEVGKKAKGDGAQVVYDPKSGELDFKGKGDAGQKLVAHLAVDLDLSASDILVIA